MPESGSREVLFEHEMISVWFHRDPGIVHHQIHAPARGEPFRKALSIGAQALRERCAKRWLSDDRKHFVIPPEDEEWSQRVWFPEALKSGWKYWAIVKPEKAMTQLFLSRLVEQLQQQGLTAHFFSDIGAAAHWLRRDVQPPSTQRKS